MAHKLSSRERRKFRIRSRVSGTADRPRLSIYRSANHIYAQVVNDETGATIAAAGTLSRDLRDSLKDVVKVVFDRNGYLYHGRIKALAEAARAAGLNF